MKLRFTDLTVLAFMGVMTLIAGNEIIHRILETKPTPQPAIVTEPTVRTIPLAPVPSTAAPSTTTTSEAPKTAHDALQADLGVLIAPDTPCQEWAPLALEVGWPVEELVNVLKEMWQESRCLNIVPGHKNFNGHDHGPLQINQVWADETANLFGSWDRIDEPAVNLAMALEIWRWHDHHRGCGWEPWSRTC